MAKFVERDQSQLYLLPADMRKWVPEHDLSHFVLEAVNRVPMSAFVVNERGTGSAQYHPRMMLALLVYCYANGIFGSRRIERATYRDIGVRYVALNCHPDHDTICAFRWNNFEVVAKAFEQILLMAKELKLLRVGTVNVDGTKVDANANKRNNVRYDRAQALRPEIETLLNRVEQEDSKDAVDPQALPGELSRRERLRERLDQACAELKRRARAAAATERASYERKMSERERRKGSRKGRRIRAPREEPAGKQQINLTHADSGLMRKSKQHEYRQAYNAQAVVDAGGSQLVLGARMSSSASDRRELVADVDAVPSSAGTVKEVLADNGYATGSEVAKLEQRGIEVLVATTTQWRRRYDFRPPRAPRPQREVRAEWIAAMREKMVRPEKSARYRLRQQTVEPVFGIVKQAMGFRQFLLRGIDKVQGEWGLVMLAYTCKRLHNLARA